ncbi:Protein R02C2.7 [Aphelenchoides avenae]|nr:Protein R02C2.7 [Aphelenchus avenae]
MNKEKILKRLQDFQKSYEEDMKKGETRKFVEKYYHPQAVSVHLGSGVSYGHDGITQFYTPFANCGQECDMETSYDWYDQAGDGEYLVVKSHFWDKKKPEKKNPCELILKRVDGDNYQIYHEEFEMYCEQHPAK